MSDWVPFPEHILASFSEMMQFESVLHFDNRLIGKTLQEGHVFEEIYDLVLQLLFKAF